MNTVSLGDVVEVLNGYAFKSSAFTDVGPNVVRISNIQNGKVDLSKTAKVSLDTVEGKTRFELSENDLLVAMSGATTGKIGVLPPELSERAFLNQRVGKFRIRDNEKIDSNYLRYVISSKSYQDDIWSVASGVAQPNISTSQLMSFKIPLPPLPEQKRIAAILDQADGLRRQRQRALDHLNQLGQSIFYEMFSVALRAGDPKKWPKLEDLLSEKLRSGAYYPKEDYSDTGIEMVHMSDAFHDQVIRGGLKRVICPPKDLEKYSLTKNDLLIARRSLVYQGAAKPCMIPESEEPLIFESSFIRVRPDDSKVMSEYLFYYLNLEEVKERFVRPFVTRSTISGINQTNLCAVKVMLPSISAQSEFCQKIRNLTNSIEEHISQDKVFAELFASLQQRAFLGEL